jgi:hypothetical protein
MTLDDQSLVEFPDIVQLDHFASKWNGSFVGIAFLALLGLWLLLYDISSIIARSFA